MQYDRLSRQLIYAFVTALLLSLYAWILVTRPEPLLPWMLVVGTVCAIWLGILSGRVIASIAGLIIGFVASWHLFFPEIVLWPLRFSALSAWQQAPALIFWLFHPFLAFATAQTGGLLLKEREKLKWLSTTQADELQRLAGQVRQYNDALNDLQDKRVYRPSLSQQLAPDSDQEPIIGLLLTAVSEQIRSNRHQQFFSGHAQAGLVESKPFFNLLLQIQPDLVAILDLQGNIITFNPLFLGIYGYQADKPFVGRSFAEWLIQSDADQARQNIGRALHYELDTNRSYAIRSASGRFRTLPVSPYVRFVCTGHPLVIAVYSTDRPQQTEQVASHPEPPLLRPDVICCLTTKGIILFIGETVASALGEEASAMVGRSIDRYIARRHLADLHSMIDRLQSGEPEQLEAVMQPKGGRHKSFRLNAWPAITSDGKLNGITLLIEDITDVKAIEAVLQHRIKIEQIITDISKRFVSVSADEIDEAIEEVLHKICESEEAAECAIEFFPSKALRTPARYRVRAQEEKNSSGADQQQARYENISVPIVAADERLGYFHFSMQKYQGSWLENDLPMIRLIGEIIVNALVRKANELNIRINEKRLSTTLQSIGDAVIATDTSGLIINMNRSAEQLTGWRFDEAQNKQMADVLQTNRPVGTLAVTQPKSQNKPADDTDDKDSIRLWSRDGSACFIAVTCSLIEDQAGAVYGEVVVFRDITREKQETDEIRYISYHDTLTGLYNRAFFEEELKRLNTQRQYPITLVLGDCNGLKIANDIFGHLEGDRLLVSIANILKSATRKEDIVARWGGDEFAIILPRTDEATAAAIRERILNLCSTAEAAPIRPSLALGSATNTDGASNLEALLKLAEDRMYRHKLMEGKSARNAILQSIKKMLYEKSYETEEHAGRMINIAHLFGRHIGLTIDELEELSLLAVLHDMGKIGIPDNILRKSGKLSADEWSIMKKHPEKGYNIAKSTPELTGIAQLILHHHEHWDGSGYPDGLKGEKIPKLSRILAIIDAFDVITHHRAYKVAQSELDALKEINRCAGTQFDPDLASSFMAVMKAALTASGSRGQSFKNVVESVEVLTIDPVDLRVREAKTPVAGRSARDVDSRFSS